MSGRIVLLAAGIVGAALCTRAADVYLVAENPNAAEPYDSWATAATNFNAAKAVLASGATLWISNGTYTASSYTIPANATVCGVNGPGVTTIDFNRGFGFTLSKADSTLSGVRICNTWSSGDGSGITASAGLVVNCEITQCDGCYYAGDEYGLSAVSLSGTAVMDRCRVYDNTHLKNNVRRPCKGIVGVSGSAIMRNTLVAGNEAIGCCGVYMGGGTVESCSIVNNYSWGSWTSTQYKFSISPSALYIASLTATVTNTIVHSNVDLNDNPANEKGVDGYEDCFTGCFLLSDGDAMFADFDADNYHLHPESPCRGTGTVEDWMADATDLDGNPRVRSAKVDIGCYQYTLASTNGATLYRRMVGATQFAPQTNEFTAAISPEGLAVDADKCWWTFDGSVPSASNYAKKGLVVTNEFDYGLKTVRFRFEYQGETYGADKTDWFMVRNSHVYLVKTNAGAAAPYGTWATAATTFDAAFAELAEGMTLVISNGTFALSADSYTIPKYATVRSETGPTNVTLTGKRFLLDRPGGTLEGVCLKSGGCLSMSRAGTHVRDCIFDTCAAGTSLPNLNATYGEITGCTFKKCTGYTWSKSDRAMVIDAIGPVLIDRCQVWNCTLGNSTAYSFSGIVFVKDGAVIRNSFLYGNRLYGYCGIYVDAGGAAENCSVISNTCLGTTAIMGSNAVHAASATASVTNILAVGNRFTDGTFANIGGVASAIGTCFTDADGDPKFTDVEKGDYTLSPDSPCIEAGTKLDWMTDDAVDLAGHKRLRGEKPDIGCYEYWESDNVKLTLYRNQLGTGVYAPQPWEFSVLIQPTTLEVDPADCWWTFDGSVPTAEHHAAEGTVVTNVFMAATNAYHTISFALRVGDDVYYNVQSNWVYVLNDVVYLVTNANPNAAAPYATRETAATNFTEAAKWLRENGTLWISNGTYAASKVTIPKNGAIRSENGPAVTKLVFPKDGGGGGVVLPNANGTLEGLYICNVWSHDKGGVEMSGASSLVTNCIIDSCSKQWHGGGVNASAGLVVDCSVTKCDGCFWEGDQYGITAVNLSGSAVMDRCLVYGNSHGNSSSKGVVGVAGSAKLRNTLVRDNTALGCSGVWVSGKGLVENCTVVANVTKGWTTSSQPTKWTFTMPACPFYVDSLAAGITNTIVSLNTYTDGTITNETGVTGYGACFGYCHLTADGDARFKKAAAGDWHLKADSPCVNAGTNLDWMAAAKDLDGEKRISGTVPDIGCYERPVLPLRLDVR